MASPVMRMEGRQSRKVAREAQDGKVCAGNFAQSVVRRGAVGPPVARQRHSRPVFRADQALVGNRSNRPPRNRPWPGSSFG